MSDEAGSVHRGGCLCGGVRYEVRGRLRDVTVCHCSQCQRTHGAPAPYTDANQADFELIEQRTLKWYRSSAKARRGYCDTCGASLFWAADEGERIGIAAGTLDQPTGLKTVAHIYAADAGDYYSLDDGLPRYADDYGHEG